MKKHKKEIRVALSLVLVLVLAVITFQKSFAVVNYSGGLLDGKRMYNSGGFTLGSLIGTDVTDNNESTYFSLENGTPGDQGTLDHIYYDFATPQTIASYRVKAERASLTMEMLDANNNLLSKTTVTTIDGSLVVLPTKAVGVSKISIVNVNNTLPMKVYEINAYTSSTGAEPTATPTPTATATPTVEPTATPTVEPTATPTPESPTGNKAILTIYLTNGTEKEYDLSMAEVNAFIDWYDQKDAGIGQAKYAFNKTWNKGPFTKRTEYVVFDKILTFNVDEYTAGE